MTNLRTNLKLLLKHHLNKSGPSAAEKLSHDIQVPTMSAEHTPCSSCHT